MPTIRGIDDYGYCVLEILRDRRGRVTREDLYREFDRRYRSSVASEDQRGAHRDGGGPPRWQRNIDLAATRLVASRRAYAPDPDAFEIV